MESTSLKNILKMESRNRHRDWCTVTWRLLCFIVTPTLLIAGIIVCVVAPHAKRCAAPPRSTVASPQKDQRLIVHSNLMRLRRIIGLTFLIILFFGIPLTSEGEKAVNLILAFFVVFPFPLVTIPYIVMSLHLLSSKRPRKIDAVAIVICTLLLLSMTNAPPLATALIPFLWIVVVAVLITRRRSSC